MSGHLMLGLDLWGWAFVAGGVIFMFCLAVLAAWQYEKWLDRREMRKRRTSGHKPRHVIRRFERARASVRLAVNRLRHPDNIKPAADDRWYDVTHTQRLTNVSHVAGPLRDHATTITGGIVLPPGTFYPASHRDQHQAWVDKAFAEVDARWRAELTAGSTT